jgi:hypothetical protein
MSPQELFNDVITTFNSKNLSVSTFRDNCVYWNRITNSKCAIGRHLPENICEIGDKREPSTPVPKLINELIVDFGYDTLPEVLKLDPLFLSDIQKLHDNFSNWNTEGLSINGKLRAKHIAKKWELNYE